MFFLEIIAVKKAILLGNSFANKRGIAWPEFPYHPLLGKTVANHRRIKNVPL